MTTNTNTADKALALTKTEARSILRTALWRASRWMASEMLAGKAMPECIVGETEGARWVIERDGLDLRGHINSKAGVVSEIAGIPEESYLREKGVA